MKPKTAVFCVILLASLASGALLGGCSWLKVKLGIKDRVIGNVPGNEDQVYRDAVSFYESGAYETVLKWVNAYEERGERGPKWPYLLHVKGLALLGLKRPAEAVSELQRALNDNEYFRDLSQEIMHHMAVANFEMGRLSRALELANKVQITSLNDHLKVNHRILKSRLYLKKGLWIESASEALATARLAGDSARVLGPLFDDAISNIEKNSDLRSLLKEYPDTTISDRLMYRLAKIELRDGNNGDGQALLRTILSRFPSSPLYSAASKQLTTNKMEIPTDGTRIGVLIPKSGKLAPIGNRALQAIRMGIKTAPRMRNKIVLIAEDSGESANDMLAAMDKLIYQHHVMAVIGPVTSKGLELVGQRAQELGVPMISLAKRDAPEADYVLQGGLTLKLQIEALAKFAVKKQGKKRFAILYPQDKLGEAAADLFWEAAEKNGGEIKAIAAYPPDETDFGTSLDLLSGVKYTDARPREMKALADQRAALKIMTKGKKTEKYYNLPPILDFDAVFLPDTLRTAGQVMPMFSYRDIEKMDFLGTSLWNAPDVVQLMPKEGAGKVLWFVDVFSNRESQGSIAQRFVEQFKELGGGEPGPTEALGFDAAAVLANAVYRMDGSNSREKLRRVLLETLDFSGVTGMIKVQSGVLVRNLKIFSIKGGQISLVERL